MGRVILAAVLAVFVGVAHAGTWCFWDAANSVATDCQSDSAGYILIDGFKVRSPDIANDRGWYLTETTRPSLTSTQTLDTLVYSLDGTTITRTWTVRDLTAEEIALSEADAMPLGEYYLWKVLIARGVITQAQAAAVLPQELIDAYLARQALEQ
jgi:hypothetical protein